jgi:hypothetical protein
VRRVFEDCMVCRIREVLEPGNNSKLDSVISRPYYTTEYWERFHMKEDEKCWLL